MLRKLICSILVMGSCFLISACATSHKTREIVPPVSLEMPVDYRMAAYLGFFSPQESFKLTEIKARIVVLQILKVKCSHCKDQTDDLKELYRLILKEGLSNQVKIIGLGYKDELYEVDDFGRRYAVPYPLFGDPYGVKVKVDEIPVTFILELTPEGGRVLYEFHGPLPSVDDLLKLVR
ncbi:MAG: redoxin domain-containing protein [Deltaproteobacteria bacterium]|nr:redoxin domain-containing protein [Deltaproteobacteria bacterium]